MQRNALPPNGIYEVVKIEKGINSLTPRVIEPSVFKRLLAVKALA
jgi:hypothetical protein